MNLNEITITGDVAFIKLSDGLSAQVDIECLDLVSKIKWRAKKSINTVYAIANHKISSGVYKTIYLHRVIINAPIGMQVDHIDMDGLNNKKSNLRLATRSQNQHNQKAKKNNTSGLKGAFWHKRYNKWYAIICKNRKMTFLGSFLTKEDAHKAYCDASKSMHGEFGRTQ